MLFGQTFSLTDQPPNFGNLEQVETIVKRMFEIGANNRSQDSGVERSWKSAQKSTASLQSGPRLDLGLVGNCLKSLIQPLSPLSLLLSMHFCQLTKERCLTKKLVHNRLVGKTWVQLGDPRVSIGAKRTWLRHFMPLCYCRGSARSGSTTYLLEVYWPTGSSNL